MSHSKGLGLCAVARGRELGVDIECIRAVTDQEQIARRFFSAQETAEWLALPVEQRHAASYYDPRPATPGKVMARWGGWLHQIDPFDLYFFLHFATQSRADGKMTERVRARILR
jgi:hypothetical protein